MTEFYLNNENLPSAGHQIQWDEHKMSEYIKCKEDPIYFAETYFKLVHVDRGLVQMELYDYQREIIETFKNNSKLCINASRQSGKCVSINTTIKLRNKNSGEIIECTVGEFIRKLVKSRGLSESDFTDEKILGDHKIIRKIEERK